MRIGLLTPATTKDLDRVVALGLRSFEWVRFAESPAGPDHGEWRAFADTLAVWLSERGLRLSSIAAHYGNPLDPKQADRARAVFYRAIEVASHLKARTVAGFPGAVVRTWHNDRGGNPVYEPFENYIPDLVNYWRPVAEFARDQGVRLAFEHCPQGQWHLPIMGFNMLDRPAMWERFFDSIGMENVGLEWDPAHLICQFIDPVANLAKFGSRVFHVHAKDAYVDRRLLAEYGPCHPGVAEHRFPGLGEANWAQIVHMLLRKGYDSDLTIEGWHDPVYRDHAPSDQTGAGRPVLAGRRLEDAGVLVARRTLEALVPRGDQD